MLMNKPARRWSTKSSRKALGSIGSLDLNTERAQNIDSPRRSRAAVLRPFGHWGGDVAVDEPVASFNLFKVRAVLSRPPPLRDPHVHCGNRRRNQHRQ